MSAVWSIWHRRVKAFVFVLAGVCEMSVSLRAEAHEDAHSTGGSGGWPHEVGGARGLVAMVAGGQTKRNLIEKADPQGAPQPPHRGATPTTYIHSPRAL